MAKVTDAYVARGQGPLVICDFSPPRGPEGAALDWARALDTDFLSIGYNPGKSPRVDSAMMAYAVKTRAGKDVVFNLATRDMNKLALQSHLLGVALLGLQNLVVVRGDLFNERDLQRVKNVSDYRPTELMRAIGELNQGLDYRGAKLAAPTDLCIGASIDLGRGIEAEARLTRRKVRAGAHFFVTQPVFDPGAIAAFRQTYQALAGVPLSQPVFYGLQILVAGGVIFSSVPEAVRQDLERGRDGKEIALELWERFHQMGIDAVYLVPPVLRGGVRDYAVAQGVLEAIRA